MRSRTTFFLLLAVAGATVLHISCRHAAAPSLVGSWSCLCDPGGTLHLRPDGTGVWVVGSGDMAEEFAIRYRHDPAPDPDHFDLYGFECDALSNLTLYGILEFVDADAFRLDVEPGPEAAGRAALRPAEFTPQTVVYRRQ